MLNGVSGISGFELRALAAARRARHAPPVEAVAAPHPNEPVEPIRRATTTAAHEHPQSDDAFDQLLRPLFEGTYGRGDGRLQLSADALRDATPAHDADEPSSKTQIDERDAHSVEGALGDRELSEDERQHVDELEKRDREVRAHEQAHHAAAGDLAQGGPSFDYQTGPNGKSYAVGGEVQIDTSPVEGDPAATIAKMQRVRRAALAPAQPSSQDRAVAAKAAQQEQAARAELRGGNSEATADRPTDRTGAVSPAGIDVVA